MWALFWAHKLSPPQSVLLLRPPVFRKLYSLPNALKREKIASGARFWNLSSQDRGHPRIPGGSHPRRQRSKRLQHLIVRKWGWQSLGHGSLTPIRNRLPFRILVPHRSPISVQSPGAVWRPPWSRGLTSSGSNWPGALPPHLGRAGPFRSYGPFHFWSIDGTSGLRGSSLLIGPCSRWGIWHQRHFTDHLIERAGWRSGRTRIEHSPGCTTWRKLPSEFQPVGPSSSVSISRGWEGFALWKPGLRIPSSSRSGSPCWRPLPNVAPALKFYWIPLPAPHGTSRSPPSFDHYKKPLFFVMSPIMFACFFDVLELASIVPVNVRMPTRQ